MNLNFVECKLKKFIPIAKKNQAKERIKIN